MDTDTLSDVFAESSLTGDSVCAHRLGHRDLSTDCQERLPKQTLEMVFSLVSVIQEGDSMAGSAENAVSHGVSNGKSLVPGMACEVNHVWSVRATAIGIGREILESAYTQGRYDSVVCRLVVGSRYNLPE